MANTSVISASRYIIMYTNSIAITSFRGDDGITAQFLHCSQPCLAGVSSGSSYDTNVLYLSRTAHVIMSGPFVFWKKLK